MPTDQPAMQPEVFPMMPSISVITLAVADLERAVRFYRDGLGWPTRGIVGSELPYGAVAFFELSGGLKLALWPQTSLNHETGVDAEGGASLPRALLSHNVFTPERVAELLAKAIEAGARCVRAPYRPVWGGWVAFFADPDGHLWEIAWNPAFHSGE
jgi:hypothetical protein